VNNDPVNWIDPWGLSAVDRLVIHTRVANLALVQGMTRGAFMYKQGGGGSHPRTGIRGEKDTYCNLSTYDIAGATGFNTDVLYGPNAPIHKLAFDKDPRYNTSANMAAQNLAEAAKQGTVVQVTPAQAQALADIGYTVIAAFYNPTGSGHLMTVSPSSVLSNSFYNRAYKEGDPFVSHVGARYNGSGNKIDNASRIPGNYTYYFDPGQFDHSKNFTFDPSGVAKIME
jgi:hypothetical protein